MSVYSFEYDPSNMKYTTGAAGIKMLDAPIEEGEEIDEDLDSPIETPKVTSHTITHTHIHTPTHTN